ncbi:MAG: hypothetical protein ACFFB2_19320 [Promethearchaeota archaeon]
MLNPKDILLRLNDTSWDKEFGGYFAEVNDTGFVISDRKAVGDYHTLAIAYLDLAMYLNDTQYQKHAVLMEQLLDRFKLKTEGYTLWLTRSWQVQTNPLIGFDSNADIVSLHTRLFDVTGDPIYINRALNSVSLIEMYHHDSIHGGFYMNLDGITLVPESDYRRVTGYYARYTEALLNLYHITNNESYLNRGCEILNETINNAWNEEIEYFHPRLFDTNEPDPTFTEFQLHEQIAIARTLLHYSEFRNQNFYQSYALSIINLIFEKGRTEDGLFIHGFYPNGTPHNSKLYVSRQCHVYQTILDMVELNITLSDEQSNTLENSLPVLESFLGQNSKLFLRTASYPRIVPWVIAVTVSTIIRLNKYMNMTTLPTTTATLTTTLSSTLPTTTTPESMTTTSTSSSAPPTVTPGFTLISMITVICIVTILFRHKRKWN